METINPVDRLGDLAIFVHVVEARSFSAAARTLGLTKSAVSKRINRLESQLGLRLLQRTTRAMSLTEAGRLLFAEAAPGVAQLAASSRQAAGSCTSRSSGAMLKSPSTASRGCRAISSPSQPCSASSQRSL